MERGEGVGSRVSSIKRRRERERKVKAYEKERKVGSKRGRV